MVKAIKLQDARLGLSATVFVEIVIWEVPYPVRGSRHQFKYRLALVADEICVLRYDNEAGKGDHRHVGDNEGPYEFVDIDRLRADFLMDARAWIERYGHR